LLVGAAIIAALTGWVVMNSTSVAERISRTARRARGWFDGIREDKARVEPVAFTAAPTKPIEGRPNDEAGLAGAIGGLDPAGSAEKDYPAGLGRTPVSPMPSAAEPARKQSPVPNSGELGADSFALEHPSGPTESSKTAETKK
jgi:hypothetical protein